MFKPDYYDESVELYNANCVEILSILNLQANLILTAPPVENIKNNDIINFDFEQVADACVHSLADGGVIVWIVSDITIDGSETGNSMRQALGFMERGLKLHDTMIFKKRHPKLTTNNRYMNAWEYMFIFSKGEPSIANMITDRPNITAGKGRYKSWGSDRDKSNNIKLTNLENRTVQEFSKRTNVWDYATGYNHSAPDYKNAHNHPAIFPLALALDHIRTWTEPGNLVLDPMVGSGTTLRAAKNLNRYAVGIEINDKYIEDIKFRLAQNVFDFDG